MCTNTKRSTQARSGDPHQPAADVVVATKIEHGGAFTTRSPGRSGAHCDAAPETE
jgi:hypothetical protein